MGNGQAMKTFKRQVLRGAGWIAVIAVSLWGLATLTIVVMGMLMWGIP